jgi:hypothetical protein
LGGEESQHIPGGGEDGGEDVHVVAVALENG